MDLSNMKNDLSEASTRIQARQLLNLVQEPIAAKLAASIDPNDSGMKAKIIAAFDTEAGKALFGILVTTMIEFMPFDNAAVNAITREIRVESMATIGDEVADLVMGPLRQVLSDFAAGKKNDPFKIESSASPSMENGDKAKAVIFTETIPVKK